MLLVYVSAFLVAAVLAAWAPTGLVFVVAFIVEGLCTSLMLIAAAPALVTGWPVAKMPITGFVMNLCVFGAVAIGPTVGGLQASPGQWRPLLWGVAGVAALALLLALLTFEDDPPQDEGAPWDIVAVVLAGRAARPPSTARLSWRTPPVPASLVPLIAGVVMLAGLLVHQYLVKHPLMPIKQLATTFPAFGILIAMATSASAIGLMDLVLTTVLKKSTPMAVALQFLPEFGAAVITAVVFALLFRTRFTPVLAISGLALVAVAAALLTGLATGGVRVAAGSDSSALAWAPPSPPRCSSPASHCARRKFSASSRCSNCSAVSPRSSSRRSCCTWPPSSAPARRPALRPRSGSAWPLPSAGSWQRWRSSSLAAGRCRLLTWKPGRTTGSRLGITAAAGPAARR